MERNNFQTCYQCCRPVAAICVNCNDHFCRIHFNEHYEYFENYTKNSSESSTRYLNQYKHVEEKILAEIDLWEQEKLLEIRKSAEEIRKVLDSYLNKIKNKFQTESLLLHGADDSDVNRFERLIIQYERSLKGIRLIRGSTLELRTRNFDPEDISRRNSLSIIGQQSDFYVPQTKIAQCLRNVPSKQLLVGSYWAIGASDDYVIVQEYENQQLIVFDAEGNRELITHWPSDSVIRDIIWNPLSQIFFLLSDKKISTFDVKANILQEMHQVVPFLSNAFRRMALYDDQLYLTYWGLETVIERIRISTWCIEHRWSSPVTCRANESITAIRLNSLGHIAVSIQDESNPLNRAFRFEIRDLNLNVLHTLPLRHESGIYSRMTCLANHQWLLINVDGNWCFIIGSNGELLDRISISHGTLSNVAIINGKAVILRTIDKLLFYDLQTE